MKRLIKKHILLMAALSLLFSLPTFSYAGEDSWERMNRRTQSFNDWADKYFLRPVASGYKKVLPRFVRTGVTNVFANVATPAIAINELLQGKPKNSLSETGRFVANTTLGIGGLFDIATPMGLAKHEEDFGQTFGRWGVASGQYVVLPFFGPSNVRDTIGFAFDTVINPIRFLSPSSTRVAVGALSVVDQRANLIGVDEVVSGDRYLFFRDAYQQRRTFLVSDGVLDDDVFEEDGFDFEE